MYNNYAVQILFEWRSELWGKEINGRKENNGNNEHHRWNKNLKISSSDSYSKDQRLVVMRVSWYAMGSSDTVLLRVHDLEPSSTTKHH